MKALEQDNEYLTKVNTQLKRETEAVQWYIQVFEGGQDTRDIVEIYSKLKANHTKLQSKHDTMLKDYSKEVKTLKKDLARVKANLVKQQEKVVNPLIREVKIREEKVNKYSAHT